MLISYIELKLMVSMLYCENSKISTVKMRLKFKQNADIKELDVHTTIVHAKRSRLNASLFMEWYIRKT